MSSVRSESSGHRFTELFRAHFREVYMQLRRLGVAPAAVDDAVQEVFIVVLRRHDEAPIVHMRGWLFAIVRRIANRHRRGAQRQHRLQDALAWEPVVAVDAQAAAMQRQAANILAAFIDRLGDEQREVFILAELEQMTALEIARTLGIKANTVSSRLRAARQEFDRNFARVRLRERRATGEAAIDDRELLLSHARRADEPSPAARQRAWVVLLGHPELRGLGLAPEPPLAASEPFTGAAALIKIKKAPAGLASTAASKATAWVVALGVGGAVLISASQARSPRTQPSTAPSAIVAPRDEPARANVDAHAEPAAPVQDSVPPAPELAPRRAREARRASPADDLQREAALMASARAELRRGDPSAAQRLLVRHAREFPAGALADERELSKISVLCALGEGDAARRAAAELAGAHPDAPLARRAAELCPANNPTSAASAGD